MQPKQQQPILIVEDNEADALWLRHLFRTNNVLNGLAIARTAEEALNYITRKGQFAQAEKYPLPILLIVDVRLPDRSGTTLAKQLHDKALNIPYVLVSAYGTALPNAAIEFPDVLEKPVSFEALLKAISQTGRLLMHVTTEGLEFRSAKPLPNRLENVLVSCTTFRCLGYHDGKVWRSAMTHEELQDVVDYQPL